MLDFDIAVHVLLLLLNLEGGRTHVTPCLYTDNARNLKDVCTVLLTATYYYDCRC